MVQAEQPTALQEDIDFMRDELRSMRALLAKLVGADGNGDGDDDGDADKDGNGDGLHLDVQVREVSRLSADIEACVDDYTRRVEDSGGSEPARVASAPWGRSSGGTPAGWRRSEPATRSATG